MRKAAGILAAPIIAWIFFLGADHLMRLIVNCRVP
jgi:hypothetical protein